MLQSITVFCGSANTCPKVYADVATHVGKTIAAQGKALVYGGGSRGLMGLVALGAKGAGGRVVGVNFKRFAASKYQLEVDEYHVTDTMQERKVALIELGDACVALPGGVGTFDELMEIFSLAQLGILDKPFGLLNVEGYFDGLLMQLKRANEDNFLKDRDYARLCVAEDIETLLAMLEACARNMEAQDNA